MKMVFCYPVDQPTKFRLVHNGEEVFASREFAAGEKPEFELPQPRVPGEGELFIIQGGEQRSMGSARYDEAGIARMMVRESESLEQHKHYRKARSVLRKAIALLETHAPNDEWLANAYLHVCFDMWFARGRKATQRQRRQDAIGWYEKAIGVYERSGDLANLGGNLTNLSELYRRFGDNETALARALRGLEIEKQRPKHSPESVGAWTHVAGTYLLMGKLDEAEAVIKDGLATLGENTPNCGYLWAQQAEVFQARAKRCREKAEEILPPQHCAI